MKKYLCIVDLEATCWPDHKSPGPGGQGWVEPQTEIIEIGATMVSLPELAEKGEFDQFVRPKLNPTLTDFCKGLTSIHQEDIDRAESYPAVQTKLSAWISTFGSKSDVLFSSWGLYDKKQFIRDCDLHQVPFPFDDEHLNLKNYVAERIGGKRRGIAKTLSKLGMEFEGTPHRGIDDVRNIVRILRKAGIGDLSTAITARLPVLKSSAFVEQPE